ncbi:MIF4G like-domain-containing protein [Naematelia encephala]|uniref:MIF4G like-domain-containing protein n=1 Tax=Naematelia encephala TaxID=71784 RepID=A0A1Y2ATD1_9TREE|nr:MIF4G like-domain-containing protein [Naematelia encephala]
MRKQVIKLGDEEDFDPIEDPRRLARVLKKGWKEGAHGVCDGFRIGVTQEPHKHPYFVSLLIYLSRRVPPKDDEEIVTDETQTGEKRKAVDEAGQECGKDVLEDLRRAFRGWVEGRQWIEVRLCLQFFSLLVPAGLVSALSLLEVYRSLLSVLNEVGGGGDRAERAVRAVGEGLMRSGSSLHALFPDEVDALVSSIEGYILDRYTTTTLNSPFAPFLPHGEEVDLPQSVLGQLLGALHNLREGGYNPPECLTRPWEGIPGPEGDEIQSDPSELTAVSMPPELYDEDDESGSAGEGQTGTMVLFAEDVVLPFNTLNGWTLRSLVLDIINIFEVNRKECARLLLALRQFLAAGTFKSESSASTLSLESLVVSTLLSTLLRLPTSPGPLIHYGSVITELCKASPNTVAPPVGRSVRKIFGLLGSEGLDVEIAGRVAEWFSTHLSNFGFQWMWKEWIPELELPAAHPRRAFMRRIVELEVRLAYHDRIRETLPEPMLVDGAGVIPSEQPDPNWVYEKDDHPLHAEAVELLKLFRQKASANDVRAHLETLPNASSGPGELVSPQIRAMAVETLLHLGSRSFSHFLNATERYLDMLRFLTPDPASRQTLLDSVGTYWKRSSQMRLVTVDKYLQYGVLEGLDVVDWVFGEDGGAETSDEEGDGWTDGEKWEVLKMTLDKLVGKVTAVRRRARQVEKEDEAAKARRAAEALERGEGVGEDEVEPEDVRLERSKEARDAQTSLDIQISKLERVLRSATRHFVADLVPWCFDPASSAMGLKSVLTLLDSGVEGMWSVRAKFGWWKHFVRLYQPHLLPLSGVVNSSVFSHVPKNDAGEVSVEKRAEEMVRAVWVAAGGVEE